MALDLIADGFTFLEGPRFDANGTLYFSDTQMGGVFCRTPDGKITHKIPERKWIGGLAINADGRVVAAGHGGLILFDFKTGKQETLIDKLDGAPIMSINDIQPDGDGGLYAGLIDLAAQTQLNAKITPQPLILIAPDRKVRRVAEGIECTNGIGLSPDRRTLYQVETMKGVLAYDRAPDGSLSNRRMPVVHAFSDGIAVDSEGFVWVAAVQGACVARFAPDGTLERRIDMPVKEITSLTFGGADLRDLYIVTGSDVADATSGGFNAPGVKTTGRIYRTRTDVAGQPATYTRF